MFAASNGHADIVLLLLQCNPEVDAVNSFRWTALYAACANGHLPAVQVPPTTI
jgi:ankyrin repeat protein